jgi:hypothetical protein
MAATEDFAVSQNDRAVGIVSVWRAVACCTPLATLRAAFAGNSFFRSARGNTRCEVCSRIRPRYVAAALMMRGAGSAPR